ncbi:membrane protein FAM174A-like isoform X2 [Heptranchias perlo]|uniref:membrane protein FAM174A-like isoform X2 n=1 Tax=Heptranchias perlo TaxID=212740 RepID=UPI00355A866E
MSVRLCRPRLLCLWLMMWAGDAVPGLQLPIERKGAGPDPGVSANSSSSSSSTVLVTGGKKNHGEYSIVSGTEQTMMIQRALYVLVAVTALVVVYFVVRTIRMRRINRKNRKYGILNTNLENMEMRPLDQEDDDEDDTLFDVNHSRRKGCPGAWYIGETMQTLRQRMNGHRATIARQEGSLPVGEHFSSQGHSATDLWVDAVHPPRKPKLQSNIKKLPATGYIRMSSKSIYCV